MGKSKFSFLFVISAFLFVATTGASVLRGEIAPPAQEATRIESIIQRASGLGGRHPAVEAIAPDLRGKMSALSCRQRRKTTGTVRWKSASSEAIAAARPRPFCGPGGTGLGGTGTVVPPAAGNEIAVALAGDKPVPKPLPSPGDAARGSEARRL